MAINKDQDDTFHINGPIAENPAGALSQKELLANLESAKKWRTHGLEQAIASSVFSSENDRSIINGFSQGINQCFSTCVVAWAAMQEDMSRQSMVDKRNLLHRAIGDDDGVFGLLGKEGANKRSLITNIIQVMDIGLEKDDITEQNLVPRYIALDEIKTGKDTGTILATGGGLIIQNRNHYLLVFINIDKHLSLFDPIGGRLQNLRVEDVYKQAVPNRVDSTFIPIISLKPPSDFVMSSAT